LEVYLAALQAGWYLVPINHHLVAPEVAYILKDSGAKVFVAHERFADVAIAAADEAGVPGSGRLAVGDIDGFGSYAGVRDAQPTTLPEDRTIGDVMNYTSGTTGNPKGIFRKLLGVTPEQAALGLSGILFLFGIQPQDDNVHIIGSPLYHTAVLRFGSASLHLGHTSC
jgi:long-chain acyl-CoA synthetase